ncbi:hypothetical protein TNCV_3575571 [Trichonephila clavipes]|nr:hypothetical protein TNCV_3575571 [Trichonephila clavipes]
MPWTQEQDSQVPNEISRGPSPEKNLADKKNFPGFKTSAMRMMTQIIRQYHPCSATPYLVAGCSRDNPLHEPNHSLLPFYLPPNTVIHQHDLNNLAKTNLISYQHPLSIDLAICSPSLQWSLTSDTLWGSAKTNPHLDRLILNKWQKIPFTNPHDPFTQRAHLSPSSPKNNYNSDHFPGFLELSWL